MRDIDACGNSIVFEVFICWQKIIAKVSIQVDTRQAKHTLFLSPAQKGVLSLLLSQSIASVRLLGVNYINYLWCFLSSH